jgi:hypothetical protein
MTHDRMTDMGAASWRRLADGTLVNVPKEDEPHVCEIVTERGESRSHVFVTAAGDRVRSVTVDGERWTRPAPHDWDVGLTD